MTQDYMYEVALILLIAVATLIAFYAHHITLTCPGYFDQNGNCVVLYTIRERYEDYVLRCGLQYNGVAMASADANIMVLLLHENNIQKAWVGDGNDACIAWDGTIGTCSLNVDTDLNGGFCYAEPERSSLFAWAGEYEDEWVLLMDMMALALWGLLGVRMVSVRYL